MKTIDDNYRLNISVASRMDHSGLVLVVEDDSTLAWAIARFLQERKFDCVLAQSVEEALTLLGGMGNRTLLAVLADYLLPGKNGSCIIEHCRSIYPDLPAALMSGLGDETAERWAADHEIFFLRKSFGCTLLAGWLDRAVAAGGTRMSGTLLDAAGE